MQTAEELFEEIPLFDYSEPTNATRKAVTGLALCETWQSSGRQRREAPDGRKMWVSVSIPPKLVSGMIGR